MNIFIIPTDTCFGIATPINDILGYNKIYEIKKRDLSKPLAIIVDNFGWLEENTILNNAQIDFLKNYNKPFTILTETKNSILPPTLLNIDKYKKVAFRVAHNFMHHKLIRLNNGPLFLTSANRSLECELFSSYDIREIFKDEIQKYSIDVFAHPGFCIKSKLKSSDIFEFVGDSLDTNYLRKN